MALKKYELDGYLILTINRQRHGQLSARFVSKSPALDRSEIAVKIKVDIPKEFFERPQLQFNISVPDEAVPKQEITAEVVGNIQNLIQQNLGIDVKLISETKDQ